MLIFPNAKINIGLNIINRRDDGYHNLETVFYPVGIKDALEIVAADELSFESSGLEIPGRAEDNLCLKGYQLLKKDFDLPPVKIHLHKHIPIGAGLGGGSADAAFFIRLVDQNFNLKMSDEQMIGYARRLGADCAFFIQNKPVFAFEKGDEFESIRLDLSKYEIVVVMPPVHVSTAEAYRGVTPAQVNDSLMDLIYEPVNEWKKFIKNDFEVSVFKNHPEIRGVKAALYEAGAIYASMSGSGASVFGIFEDTPDLSALEAENKIFYC
ncbi:4-(cytidine 5'-diphospho)-2-C-methyl-D-erythritol kinase [Mucilaginibacter sp. L3T2-6]|uniref:4-(cytidine 5'-diphospho)-2-C-methyl-D-erythritol kinase n=1 Tax=Mucilaginibacter sp. L3T2-6 TaxID=3062491 RepID=UPI002675D1B0|nr:4-(cytidine 5'-diphospho)-2-C-methyl-D-erythritol kinase [Mucilaginibacter sp. L3T2-6]MDO3642733.1 4-(cytidine 5'-diphospho)-2-C-methyl-D-erythritol kinase [Mucilaginibacter sp. L3T2-6]MDV6215382.1 4-(cytidine 5'-diphospho)-2-C-methyl-D-erythritol kinase [Mucilaginibacter sp. L3T2-6]